MYDVRCMMYVFPRQGLRLLVTFVYMSLMKIHNDRRALSFNFGSNLARGTPQRQKKIGFKYEKLFKNRRANFYHY